MMQVGAYELRSQVLPLLRRFEAAQVTDKDAERRASALGKRAGCTFGLAILVLFGAAMASDWVSGWIFAVPVLLVVAGIVFVVGYVRARRFDLDDRKLSAIVRLLTMLNADTPREAQVRLGIDFRPYEKGGTKLSEEKLDRWGSQRVKKYTHRWLTLSGLLADGTHYQLSVAEAITRKEKRKRKYTKVRESIRSAVNFQLRLRAPKYGEAQAVAASLQQEPPPQPLTLKAVAARGQRLSVTVVTPKTVRVEARSPTPQIQQDQQLTGDMLLQTMLWTYNGIAQTLARKA